MIYQVLASGSTGNSVLYHGEILIDIGVPYSLIRPYIYKIKIILLTHEHGDHLNIATLTRISKERPLLRIGAGNFLAEKLRGIRNIDFYETGLNYDYGPFSIIPVTLYHDVPNFGYRIFRGNHKIFHATDTSHLQGITAKGYNLYALEHSYDEDVIGEIVNTKTEKGQFSYEKGAINSHLSEQQARQFIFENGIEGEYDILRLHESRREYSKL